MRDASVKIKKQGGAAILVVILILLVITVLGVSAVRMGLTSLTIATNSQVSALIFQSADTALVSFEQKVLLAPAAAALPDGIIGPSLNVPGVERPYCMTKANKLKEGVCSPNDYTSSRDAVQTQVSVEVPAAADGSPMKAIVLGSDMDRAGIPTYRVRTHSSAVMPVFGAASSTEITACLAKVNDDNETPATVTATDCLTDAGAVFTTMMQEYDYGFN